MDQNRIRLYESLESQIGSTPLVELPLDLPRGNRILVKEEFRNPTGSHYDRQIYLLRAIEEQGKIIPGLTPLIETTSGSAGESFAWLCQQLGYEATIVLPDSAPPKKIRAMQEYGANLVFTPGIEGVGGTARELKKILIEENPRRKEQGLQKYYCPNHSRDPRTLEAFGQIAVEACEQVEGIDYFIAAIGNGSTLLGPGRHFKQRLPNVQVVGWEPLASGLAYSLRFPGELEELYGLGKGSLRHDLPGTGVPNVEFPFLHEAVMGEDSILDRIVLVQGKDTEGQFRFKVDPNHYITRQACAMSSVHGQWANVRRLPDWEKGAEILKAIGHEGGRTTAGGLIVAKRIIDEPKYRRVWKRFLGIPFPWSEAEHLEDKTFLIIGYDSMEKY